MKVIFETTRLILRHVNQEDSDFIYSLYNDDLFLRYIGQRGISSEEKASEYITNHIISSYEKNGYGIFLVVEKSHNKALGVCGLVKRKGLSETDLGFAFIPEARGKGYAYEASQGVLIYAKDILGIEKLVAITHPENLSSIKLLERLGMKFIKNIILPGEKNEVKLFSI